MRLGLIIGCLENVHVLLEGKVSVSNHQLVIQSGASASQALAFIADNCSRLEHLSVNNCDGVEFFVQSRLGVLARCEYDANGSIDQF